MSREAEAFSERVLVVAPTRRDGEVTQKILAAASMEAVVLRSFDEVGAAIDMGVGALVLTDIALAEPQARTFLQVMQAQPAWSSIPLVMLCRDGFQSPPSTAVMRALTNVTVLDRPCSTRAMVSAIKAALRGRRWQYQIRDQIAELRRVEMLVREASQRKDEFLATLAHELRNPLAPIQTGLNLLNNRDLPHEKFEEMRAMMERQLDRLVQLIDDLLDVARISTGKVVLKRERVALQEVIRTAVESCEPALRAAHHHLTLDLPERPLNIVVDAVRLAQVVSNLLSNAIKYTEMGGRISIGARAAGSGCEIAVQDNGIGIPAAMQGRIFDMFTQIGPAAEYAQGGLGIGLSLVKRLVELHGGTVGVQSAVGRGSTFTIGLPGVVAREERDDGRDASAAATGLGPTRPRRILVVDDNRDAADALMMLLEIGGHEVHVEYGGKGALSAAIEFLPDVVFCDIGMPGMSGIDVAKALRADDRFVSTTLVAVTGWGAEEDLRRSRHAGFDSHLTKPVNEKSIAKILSDI